MNPTTQHSETPSKRPNGGDYGLFVSITLLGAAADIASKYAVFNWLGDAYMRQHVFIENVLLFKLAENPGAAFSMFAGMTWFFIAVSVIALIVVNTMFFLGKLTPRLMLAAMACMNAGILGNLYDRLFNDGLVRDFIQVYIGSYPWPTFNIADSLLCIGVAILMYVSFTAEHAKK